MRVETFNGCLLWIPLSLCLIVTILCFMNSTPKIRIASQCMLTISCVCLVFYQFMWCSFFQQAGVTDQVTRTEMGIYMVPNKVDGIYDYLRMGKHWEADLINEMGKYVKPGDIVVDAGAHIGTHSIPLSKMVGASGRVYAAEPFFINTLRNNVKLNEGEMMGPVTVLPYALSNNNGKVFMSINNAHNGSSMIVSKNTGTMVETRTLDSLLSLETGKISFIKMDVEGHEKEVLQGAKDVILKHKPVIFIEILPWTTTGTGTRDLLNQYGYVLYRFHNNDYIAFPRVNKLPTGV